MARGARAPAQSAPATVAYTDVMARVLDLRLELRQVRPLVWRVLRVPADLALLDLHHAIQVVMGWEDFHPHLFEVGDREYGPPADDAEAAAEDEGHGEPDAWAGDDRDLTVGAALAQSPAGFTYVYDFQEDWRVDVAPVGDAAALSAGEVFCLAGGGTVPAPESPAPSAFSPEEANRRLSLARRPRATADHPAGRGAPVDRQWLAHLSLVVLMLGSRPGEGGTREASKTIRPEVLDWLQEAGLVEHEPQRRAATLTDAGVARARRLLQKLRSLPLPR